MELEFMPIDYEALELEDKSYVRIIGRTGSGKRVCLINDCDIYFWAVVKEGISDKKIESLREKIEGFKIHDGSRVTKVIKTGVFEKKFLGQSVKGIKVFLDNYKNMQKIAEKVLGVDGIDKVREHDLQFITRYILEKNLVPMSWSRITGDLIAKDDFGGIVESIDADVFLSVNKNSRSPGSKRPLSTSTYLPLLMISITC